MTLSWIRRIYGVPARRSARVVYAGGDRPQAGTITGARGGHLRIRLDGQPRSRVFHPTWKLDYAARDVQP